MVKKIVLIVLLVVLMLGIALVAQWYADTHLNKTTSIKVLDLETQTFDLGKGIKLEMVHLPAGTFRMGSAEDVLSFLPGRAKAEENEKPAHAVELSEFWMGKYEVTQEQYEVIMGNNPSSFTAATNPVENVSWDDAMEFCRKLSNSTGTSFTLPTEAQWEYACRAGSTTVYCYGNMESGLGDYAWYGNNSGGRTHPVGQMTSNYWGLYDMHGNVWEWCRDYFDENFYSTPTAKLRNPENTKSASFRVLRGGSWPYSSRHCRSAHRISNYPDDRIYYSGFRVVRTQP